MRKVTLFLMSLFLTIGAMAETETIVPSTSEEIHMYTLKNANNFYMTSFTSLTEKEANCGRFAFYAVEGVNNAYKIYSVDRELWVSYTKASGYSNTTNFAKLVETQEEAEYWHAAIVNNSYQIAPYNTNGPAAKYMNFYQGKSSNPVDNTSITVGLYEKGAVAGNNGDGGSRWMLTSVESGAEIVDINATLTDANGVEYTTTYKGVAGKTEPALKDGNCTLNNKAWNGNNFTANVAFNISLPRSGSNVENAMIIHPFANSGIYYTVNGTQMKATKTVPNKQTLNNYLWAVYTQFKSTGVVYIIKHVATGKYVKVTNSTRNSHDDGIVIVSDEATEFVLESNNRFKILGSTKYLSTGSSSTADQNAGAWDSHNGVNNSFAKENNYRITDAAGNVFEGVYDGYGIFDPTFTGDNNYILSSLAWSGNTRTANIQFSFPVSKVGEKPNATLLGIWDNNKIWHAAENGIKVQTVAVAPVDLNCMWAIYPVFNNGKFTFRIKNIATDKYVYSEAEDDTSNVQSSVKPNIEGTVVLSENASEFEIDGVNKNLKFSDKSKLFLSINSSSDTDVLLGVHNVGHTGTNVKAPTLNTFNVTVGEFGYATLYTPWEVSVPTTVTAHTVTVEDGWAKFSEESLQIIPAGEAVILMGEGTHTFTLTNTGATAIEGNLLEGTAQKTRVTKPANTECYILYNLDGNVGFYATSIADDKSVFYNSAYKAYLAVENLATEAPAQLVGARLPGTTAVEEVEVENAETIIYDLAGRRIEKITQAGIYIVNGNKVLVK